MYLPQYLVPSSIQYRITKLLLLLTFIEVLPGTVLGTGDGVTRMEKVRHNAVMDDENERSRRCCFRCGVKECPHKESREERSRQKS